MTIQPYNNDAHNAWNRGKYKVMIKSPDVERPFAFCDGTDEDRAALFNMAEEEGLIAVELKVKPLKNDREVWMLYGEQV